MKRHLAALLVAAGTVSGAAAADEDPRAILERAVVGLSVTWQAWDEDQPWIKRRPETRRAAAVMVGENLLLTTAQILDRGTFVQLETFGRARPGEVKVVRIDLTSNLVLLSADPAALEGLAPVALAERTPATGTLRTARWRAQSLEAAASRIIRVEVERTAFSHTHHAFLRMRTDMSGGGWSEPVFDGVALAGITVSQSEDESRAIPVEILRRFLERPPGHTEGLPTLGVNWQLNKETAVTRYLGQAGEPRGILVRQVPWGTSGCGVLKPRDILLELAGEAIDAEGYYRHAWLGRLGFNHIVAERFRHGEALPARILRDGREMDVTLTARAYPAALNLVPIHQPGAPPYIVAGGLVLRELDVPYLATWGREWSKDAPDALLSRYYYGSDGQSASHRRVVIIASVLPSGYNVGYHDLRDAIVDRVNGRSIGKIEDVEAALAQPAGEFHVFDLAPESMIGQVVLDAEAFDAAGAEILEAYAVPSARAGRAEPLPEGGGACEPPAH